MKIEEPLSHAMFIPLFLPFYLLDEYYMSKQKEKRCDVGRACLIFKKVHEKKLFSPSRPAYPGHLHENVMVFHVVSNQQGNLLSGCKKLRSMLLQLQKVHRNNHEMEETAKSIFKLQFYQILNLNFSFLNFL